MKEKNSDNQSVLGVACGTEADTRGEAAIVKHSVNIFMVGSLKHWSQYEQSFQYQLIDVLCLLEVIGTSLFKIF